jgi:hypothetical protein
LANNAVAAANMADKTAQKTHVMPLRIRLEGSCECR